jgi:hypothetical protein
MVPANNMGMSYLVDGIFNTNTPVFLTHNWSAVAYYEHVWTPQWRTSLYGGLLGTDFGSQAIALICSGGAAGTPAPVGFSGGAASVFMSNNTAGPINGAVASTNQHVSNCNPNSSWTQLGTRTMWNPVPDLDVGFDLSWVHLNTAFAGTANLNGFGTPFQPNDMGRPGGAYTITNQDIYSVMFRIQRNFLYGSLPSGIAEPPGSDAGSLLDGSKPPAIFRPMTLRRIAYRCASKTGYGRIRCHASRRDAAHRFPRYYGWPRGREVRIDSQRPIQRPVACIDSGPCRVWIKSTILPASPCSGSGATIGRDRPSSECPIAGFYLTVLLRIFLLVTPALQTALRPRIDVIGKDHINAGKAKQFNSLSRAAHLIGGTRAFQRLVSVRFEIRHFVYPPEALD